jgi:uncharacterized membrane protein
MTTLYIVIVLKLAFIGYATTGSGILLAISLCRLHDFISVSILNTLPMSGAVGADTSKVRID